MPIHTQEIPEFLAKRYNLSDPELDSKITERFNSGYWIENILSNEDDVLIIYAKFKNDIPQLSTTEKANARRERN